MRGGNLDSACAALIDALADRVARLGEDDSLVVVELTSDGVKIWKIHREPNGTPRCRYWNPTPWLTLFAQGELDQAALRDLVSSEDGSPIVLVRTSDGPRAEETYHLLSSDAGTGYATACGAPLDGLLDQVLTNDGLTQFYELVVLSPSKSGRSELGTHKLFPPGSQRGATRTVHVRCEPTDENGTAFAVVAFAKDGGVRLVSIRSVRLPPGSYPVTVELRRPGRVSFNGLDGEFRPERRSWSDLVASLPDRIDLIPAVHLICLIETSGSADDVDERIGRLEQLIQELPGALVSLVSYGPHAVARDLPEGPVEILSWAQPTAQALKEVDNLKDRPPWPLGYAGAAQLECGLYAVAERLAQQDAPGGWRDRQVAVVTIGARPAFPPGRNLNRHIPCPDRNDWRELLRRLSQHHTGIAFGAIVDRDADHDIWQHLGGDALAFGGTFVARNFIARLGLINPSAGPIPFPLLES